MLRSVIPLSILKRRPDLRLVVSSATLNVDFFQEYFVRSDIRTAVVAAQGRTFPVDLHYLVEPCENYLNATIEAVMHIHEAVCDEIVGKCSFD